MVSLIELVQRLSVKFHLLISIVCRTACELEVFYLNILSRHDLTRGCCRLISLQNYHVAGEAVTDLDIIGATIIALRNVNLHRDLASRDGRKGLRRIVLAIDKDEPNLLSVLHPREVEVDSRVLGRQAQGRDQARHKCYDSFTHIAVFIL